MVGRAAWVPAGEIGGIRSGGGLAVLGALRQTVPGLALVRELTAAPDLDGWTITERLWLVIDDLHELGSYPGPAFTPRATPAVPAWSLTKTTAACSTSPSSAPVWNVNAKNKPSRFASTARVKILSVANLSSVRLAWISLAATGSSSRAHACTHPAALFAASSIH